MSKTVKVIAGAAIAVVGVVTANPSLVISGLSLSASALLAPKVKQQERQASVTALSIGETSREAIFGEAVTGGSFVDGFNWGGKYGTDWEALIIALADHECDGLVGFYVNDQYVAFGGDGNVAGYNNQLQVYFGPGTATQTLPAIVTANAPGWSASDVGQGVCYVVVAYKADASDAKNPIWTAGRPAFRWRVKGKKCYIARKDGSLPGGAGAHRWTDPTTWEWTDNPIDCRYNWVRGVYACNRITDPTMLLVGRGLSDVEAPPVNTFAPANLCDELVNGVKRYRVGGVIRADDTFVSVEEMFAASTGGVIVQPQGSVEIEPGQAKSPVAYITDSDLVTGSAVSFSSFLSRSDGEWINTVLPRYVEPTQGWQDHAAPIRRVDADVVTDGGPREEVLSLPLVTNGTQAGRIGEIRRRLGRLWKRATITLGPRFAALEEGDWIVWTSARYLKGASVTFRVESYSLDKKWQNTLNLREINATVFSEGTFIPDTATALAGGTPPSIGAPRAAAWALSAQQLTDGTSSLPAIVITGAVDDSYAQGVRIEYWKSDGVTPAASVTNWTDATVHGPGITRREIASVVPGAVYYAAVSYVVNGVPGDRRILGPVTAGSVSGTPTPWPSVTNPDGTKPANNATKNLFYRQAADPALGNAIGEDEVWIDTSSQPHLFKVRKSGAWVTTATFGADLTAQLFVAGSPVAKEKLLNDQILLNADGTLSFWNGAGWINLGATTLTQLTGAIALTDPRITGKSLANLDATARAELTSAKNALADIAADNKLTGDEKTEVLLPQLVRFDAALAALDAIAKTFGIGEYATPGVIKNAAGTTVTALGGGGYSISKNVANGTWDASAVSVQPIGGKIVLTIIPTAVAETIGGVSRAPLADNSYPSIEHGLYFTSAGRVQWFGQGQADVTSYAVNDVFFIIVDGPSIIAVKNGVTLKTWTVAAGQDWYFDSTLQGGSLTVNFGRADEHPISVATGVTVTNRGISGDSTVTKTASYDWSNASAISATFTGDIAARIRPMGAALSQFMAGLNTDPATDAGFTSIDYALHFTPAGGVEAYESGGGGYSIGSWAEGDTFFVVRRGTTIVYLKGESPDTATVLRTVSSGVPSGPMGFDSALLTQGAYFYARVDLEANFLPFGARRAPHAARTALYAYLSGLAPAYNDTTQTTTIVRATYDSYVNDYAAGIETLDREVKRVASTKATWSGVSDDNGKRPEDSATVGAIAGPAGNLKASDLTVLTDQRFLNDQQKYSDVVAGYGRPADNATVGGTIALDIRLPDLTVAPQRRLDNQLLQLTGSSGQLYLYDGVGNIDLLNLSDAGIAALAYKAQASWQVDVAGIGKPEDNADITSQVIAETPAIVIERAYDGTIKNGQLGVKGTYLRFFKQGVSLTSGVTWSYIVRSGTVNGLTVASGYQAISGAGSVHWLLDSLDTDAATIEFKGSTGAAASERKATIAVSSVYDGAPATGGSGGGSGGTSSGDVSINTATSSTSAVVVSPECVVNVGSAGTVTLTAANVEFYPGRGSPSGGWTCYLRWRWYNGSAWVEIGTGYQWGVSQRYTVNEGGEVFIEAESAFVTHNMVHTNTANATNQRYQLVAYLSSARTHSIAGTCSAQG